MVCPELNLHMVFSLTFRLPPPPWPWSHLKLPFKSVSIFMLSFFSYSSYQIPFLFFFLSLMYFSPPPSLSLSDIFFFLKYSLLIFLFVCVLEYQLYYMTIKENVHSENRQIPVNLVKSASTCAQKWYSITWQSSLATWRQEGSCMMKNYGHEPGDTSQW